MAYHKNHIHTIDQADSLEEAGKCGKWYAVYTRSRHEKVVAKYLEKSPVEVFLPTYKTINQWKDRKKAVWLPLFSGYLFVMMESIPEECVRVLRTPGVVTMLGNRKGEFKPISQADIDKVRRIVEVDFKKDPCPFITEGQKVKIKNGPLEGLGGILLKKKNEYQVVISLELLQRSVAVTVDPRDLSSSES